MEVYFSVVQRKVLDPNDFASLDQVSERLLGFQKPYEVAAQPFQWKFTRCDLKVLFTNSRRKLRTHPTGPPRSAKKYVTELPGQSTKPGRDCPKRRSGTFLGDFRVG